MILDYSLRTPEERVEYVNKFVTDNLSNAQKQQLSDYILFVAEKNQTKINKEKNYGYLTKNREVTINKRECSFEQITESLENGEDGIYALINNDKNQFLENKEKISKEDIENIPGIKDLLDIIENLKKSFDKAHGKRRHNIKKQIIETWQQIYILKQSAKPAQTKAKICNMKILAHMPIPETITLDINGNILIDSPASLLVPEHVSALLCNYSQLKQETTEDLQGDMKWLLIDLEDLAERTFKNDPVLMLLLQWKIDGLSNEKIQEKMEVECGIVHNEQYYSTLWRKRIPKMIAEQARKEWLIWHFNNEEYGEWKYCNRCGKWKPAHQLFFSKNTSKDNFYSICKECRSNNI